MKRFLHLKIIRSLTPNNYKNQNIWIKYYYVILKRKIGSFPSKTVFRTQRTNIYINHRIRIHHMSIKVTLTRTIIHYWHFRARFAAVACTSALSSYASFSIDITYLEIRRRRRHDGAMASSLRRVRTWII